MGCLHPACPSFTWYWETGTQTFPRVRNLDHSSPTWDNGIPDQLEGHQTFRGDGTGTGRLSLPLSLPPLEIMGHVWTKPAWDQLRTAKIEWKHCLDPPYTLDWMAAWSCPERSSNRQDYIAFWNKGEKYHPSNSKSQLLFQQVTDNHIIERPLCCGWHLHFKTKQNH